MEFLIFERWNMQQEKLCFNVSEAARALGVSRPKMYELCRQEGFPVLVVGSRKLVPIEPLREWVRSNSGWGGKPA